MDGKHYSLVMVGAHDGSKTLALITQASRTGKVLLVEPVPFLFERLRKAVAQIPNVVLVNACVSLVDGVVEFTAPKEEASVPGTYFDQLGSLNANHATDHVRDMTSLVETILAESRTFPTLMREHGVASIDTLYTDMEGFDCELLPTFPFNRIVPKQILFEFKHSDGTFRVGRKLGDLLIALDMFGYDIRVADVENMIATMRPETPASG